MKRRTRAEISADAAELAAWEIQHARAAAAHVAANPETKFTPAYLALAKTGENIAPATRARDYTPEYWEEWERRVQALETDGLTRSDAQGCVDIQEDDIFETIAKAVQS